jgi:hypothetical protein
VDPALEEERRPPALVLYITRTVIPREEKHRRICKIDNNKRRVLIRIPEVFLDPTKVSRLSE